MYLFFKNNKTVVNLRARASKYQIIYTDLPVAQPCVFFQAHCALPADDIKKPQSFQVVIVKCMPPDPPSRPNGSHLPHLTHPPHPWRQLHHCKNPHQPTILLCLGLKPPRLKQDPGRSNWPVLSNVERVGTDGSITTSEGYEGLRTNHATADAPSGPAGGGSCKCEGESGVGGVVGEAEGGGEVREGDACGEEVVVEEGEG